MIWLLPILAGICVVLQGGWNRQLGAHWGLAGVVLVNSIVFLIGAAVLFVAVQGSPERWPEIVRPSSESGSWLQWRALLPGLCGLVIVLAIPWGIAHLGALRVMLLVVAAQLVAGLLWDRWVEDVAIDPVRVVGILLAITGTGVVMWRSGH